MIQAYLYALKQQKTEFGDFEHHQTMESLAAADPIYDDINKIGQEKQSEKEKRTAYIRDPWTKVFEKSRTQKEDLKEFVKQSMGQVSENPKADMDSMGFSDQALLKLEFLPSFVRNLRKRY